MGQKHPHLENSAVEGFICDSYELSTNLQLVIIKIVEQKVS